MYFLKPARLSFMLRYKLTKFETLKLFGFKIYGLYFLKRGDNMVDRIVLKAGESVIVDTNGNTAVICVGAVGSANVDVQIYDESNNLICNLMSGEIHTLPYNSGKYRIYYPSGASGTATIFVARYFAI